MSNCLKEKRIQLGLSIEQVVEKTKLYPSAIRDLEEGAWEAINPVYLKGWLKIYAQFLGVDSSAMVAQLPSRQSSKKKTVIGKTAPVVQPLLKPLKPYQKLAARPSYPPPSNVVVQGSRHMPAQTREDSSRQVSSGRTPVLNNTESSSATQSFSEKSEQQNVPVELALPKVESKHQTYHELPPVEASTVLPMEPMVVPGNAGDGALRRTIFFVVLAVFLCIGVVGFARFIWMKTQTAEKIRKRPAQSSASKRTNVRGTKKKTSKKISKKAVNGARVETRKASSNQLISLPKSKSGDITASITAKSTCFVRAKVDGMLLYEGMLRKGVVESWKGDKEIDLKLSDGSAVYLEVNGTPLPVLSNIRKPVKSLKITSAGISVDK